MSALGIVVLLLGTLIDVLDLTVVLLASLLVLIALEEMGYKSVSIYIVTSVLALIILPNKLLGIEYVLIGIYPIIKCFLDKRAKVVKIILKAVYMVVAVLIIVLLMNFVFMAQEVWYLNVAFGIGGLVMLVLFDILLFRFAMFYRFKLRHQLRLDSFFNNK